MSFTLKKNYNFMPFCFKGITGYIPPTDAEKDTKGNAMNVDNEFQNEIKEEEENDNGSNKDMETESQNKPKDVTNKISSKVPEQRTTQENILL